MKKRALEGSLARSISDSSIHIFAADIADIERALIRTRSSPFVQPIRFSISVRCVHLYSFLSDIP